MHHHSLNLSDSSKKLWEFLTVWHWRINWTSKPFRDREDEIKRLSEKNRNQAEESEKALSAFKEQVDKNQTRMFDDMKQQMSRVESDLNKSKQAREKQAKEFNRQIDEERANHNREVSVLKYSCSNVTELDAEKLRFVWNLPYLNFFTLSLSFLLVNKKMKLKWNKNGWFTIITV